MSAQQIAVFILLVIGVGAGLIASLAILVMSQIYTRLHYLGLASVLGAVSIAVAVAVQEGVSQAGIKALLTGVVVAITSPVLTHATARSARIREFGHPEMRPDRATTVRQTDEEEGVSG
ncbi:MAG: monovalent cation/H(+) antiporter subunit G [Chroococcidiopsidaceae cyanobacterium CP_BM_RX_35]|nr:monovalent cation/H(+) antiporter subunit G [Chroococcidiopsidaceae cyanobacterium CP_BM_RX_35]